MPVPAGGLIDRDYAKEAVGWNGTDRDELIDRWIAAATPIIERLCGPVIRRSVTQRFDGGKSGVLLPDPLLVEGDVIAVTENEVATTDWFADADSSIVYAGTRTGSFRRFLEGRKNIAVTYQVGYSTIPEPIQLAVRELVRIWVNQSISSLRPSFDNQRNSSDPTTTPQGFAVPRKVLELCAPYLRPAGFA